MKFIGTIPSRRGHKEKDYCFRLSYKEILYIRRITRNDQMMQSLLKRQFGNTLPDKAVSISVSRGINNKDIEVKTLYEN